MKIQEKRALQPTAVKIGASRQVVIPKKIHDTLGLTTGDYLEVELTAGRVVFTPKILVDKGIREGLEDIKHGRVSGPFASPRSLARALRARKRRASLQ